MEKIKVGIIFGGQSTEHDVSVVSGSSVIKNLNKEKYEIIKEHLELNLKEKGNVVGINEMRKHISAYTKNMPEASRFRDEINHITDVNILMSKIQEFFIDIFDKK